jgi:hypothetical protein
MSDYVDVETFCPKTQQQVTITLQPTAWIATTKKAYGVTVTGKPVNCNHIDKCQQSPKCLLKAERLTTRRNH